MSFYQFFRLKFFLYFGLIFSLWLFLVIFLGQNHKVLAQKMGKKFKNTEECIKFLQKKQKKWHKKYQFMQDNQYPDSVGNIARTQTILEYIQSPNTLVVYDQEEKAKKNQMVTKLHNDSLYMFVKGNLRQKMLFEMPLVWLSGGLGAYKVKEIFEKLKKNNINAQKFYQDDKIIIIGTNEKDDQTSPQVHYDAQKGFLKRVFIPDFPHWHEAIFDNQIPFGKGWLEQDVIIFKNKKLLMKEHYYEVKAPKTKKEIIDFEQKINIREQGTGSRE